LSLLAGPLIIILFIVGGLLGGYLGDWVNNVLGIYDIFLFALVLATSSV
jgi:hypothetical protein